MMTFARTPFSSFTHYSLLKKLSNEYSIKAAAEWDPKLVNASNTLRKFIPDGVTVNGRPKANGILDTINSSLYILLGHH
jgi:hypothetical protein